MELKAHQKKALQELANGKILWGGVGSGKSRVAVAYYVAQEQPRNVVVITSAKKRDSLDWDKEFAAYALSQHSDSLVDELIIDSWNNIDRYVELEDWFFIFDEQRLVGSGAWVRAFLKIAKSNRWIMLSATPGDTWLDYIPVMIANGFYKNRTEFKREHVVYKPFSKFPKVDRYLNTGRLNKLRNQILVSMPYEKLTIRHPITRYVEYNETLVASIIKNRWHIYQNRPIRDITELFALLRRVVNTDPSRVQELRAILTMHPKLVVFYNFNYELERLRALEDVTAVAEWNGHKHEEIPIAESSWVYLVQYVAGSEAWNCIETDTIVFYSLTYSYKLWENAHGRIDRLNTPFTDLFYYILRSKSVVDQAVWRSLKAKQNFNINHVPLQSLQ